MIAAMSLLVSSSASAVTHTFNGTSGNDEITLGRLQKLVGGVWVTEPGYAIRINTVTTQFTASSTDFIDVFAGTGDDSITLVNAATGTITYSSTRRLIAWPSGLQPVLMHGNAGKDHLIGSDHADIIYGGLGNDLIEAHGGNDFVLGYLAASFSSDPYCVGLEEAPEEDLDICDGAAGNDTVYCNRASWGGTGIDECVAGASGSMKSDCEIELCE